MDFLSTKGRNTTIIFYSLLIIGSFYLLSHCFYTAFWYDEAYTINLVRHSFAELWNITANDVHPPLYYVLLKLYTYIAGNSVVSLRLFSGFFVIACMIVGCTLIRNSFGYRAAFFFLLIITLLPVMQYAASEIRMYSLVMFFVLCSAISAYRCFFIFSKSNLIKLTLFSLCAAYTHYYGLIAVFFIYLILLILFLLYKKDKSLLFLGVGFIFVLGYLPWLIHVPKQMEQVADEYWINQTRLKDIIIYIYYPFSVELDLVATHLPLKDFALQFSIVAIALLILLYVVIASSRNLSDKDRSISVYANLLLSVFLCVIFFVILYSFVVKPIFVTRYMIPLIGLFVLFAAIHFGLLNYSKLFNKIIVALFFVLIAYLSIERFIEQEKVNSINQSIQNDIIDFANTRVDDNTVFLYSDTRSFAIAFGDILFPHHTHYERIRMTEKYYKQYLKNFNCIPIFDFKDVDPKFDKALIIKNVDKDDSFMSVTVDSIELMQYYEIIDRADFKGHVVYQLKRK